MIRLGGAKVCKNRIIASAVLLGLVVMGTGATSAQAVASGQGLMTGAVRILPGILLVPTNTTFTYLGFTGIMTIVIKNRAALSGSLICNTSLATLLVRGATKGETISGGSGTVSGNFAGVSPGCLGSFVGVFERVNQTVDAVLTVNFSSATSAVTVKLHASMVPTALLAGKAVMRNFNFFGRFTVESNAGNP